MVRTIAIVAVDSSVTVVRHVYEHVSINVLMVIVPVRPNTNAYAIWAGPVNRVPIRVAATIIRHA